MRRQHVHEAAKRTSLAAAELVAERAYICARDCALLDRHAPAPARAASSCGMSL